MLLSIIGNLLGDDDDGDSSDDDGQLEGGMSSEPLMPGAASGNEETDDLLDDGLDDDLGGGEFDDDLDDDGFDDDLGGGEFDDDLLDGGGDFDGEMAMGEMDDSGASSEVEARVEEMETEVGSLSSTVNTVQSENEQISESLEEIEENIRQLLEVYEMVTQGVNPFVESDGMDDPFGGGGGAPEEGGGFGGGSLFDGGSQSEDEDMDEDIANADAEDFLDESIIDGDDEFEEEMGFEEDVEEFGEIDDAEDELGGIDETDEASGDESTGDQAPAAADGGSDEDLSFDELKEQFESGDAEWAGDDDDTEQAQEAESFADETAFEDDSESPEDDAFADEDQFTSEVALAADDDEETTADSATEDASNREETTDALEDDVSTETAPPEPTPADAPEPTPVTDTETDSTHSAETAPTSTASVAPDPTPSEPTGVDDRSHGSEIPWDDGGRPYLASVPTDYETEFVVMDWLDDLVEEIGLAGATETIRLYRTLRWISEPVEEYLQTLLKGFHGGPDVEEPTPRSPLGVDHARSLWWITQIQSPRQHNPSYEEWLEQRGRTIIPPSMDEDDSWGSVVRAADARIGTKEVDSGQSNEQDPAQPEHVDETATELTFEESLEVDDEDPFADEPDLEDTSAEPADLESDPLLETESEPVQDPLLEETPSEDIEADQQLLESATADSVNEPRDQSTDKDHSHEIEIDDTASHAGTSEPVTEASEVDEDMVWVDSEAVVSRDNLEMSDLADALPAAGSEERADGESDTDETNKPVIDPADDELEEWQLELLNSVFADGED